MCVCLGVGLDSGQNYLAHYLPRFCSDLVSCFQNCVLLIVYSPLSSLPSPIHFLPVFFTSIVLHVYSSLWNDFRNPCAGERCSRGRVTDSRGGDILAGGRMWIARGHHCCARGWLIRGRGPLFRFIEESIHYSVAKPIHQIFMSMVLKWTLQVRVCSEDGRRRSYCCLFT